MNKVLNEKDTVVFDTAVSFFSFLCYTVHEGYCSDAGTYETESAVR